MKKEIIIISDLWGKTKSAWVEHFKDLLSANYNITYYDACELGEVKTAPYEQEYLHQQFVQFGIDHAVDKLLKLETSKSICIGCSVGGVIAWKAALKDMQFEKIITISSTRLRKESKKPDGPVYNFFGTNDGYKPNSDWIKSPDLGSTFLLEGEHDIYTQASLIKEILYKSRLL